MKLTPERKELIDALDIHTLVKRWRGHPGMKDADPAWFEGETGLYIYQRIRWLMKRRTRELAMGEIFLGIADSDSYVPRDKFQLSINTPRRWKTPMRHLYKKHRRRVKRTWCGAKIDSLVTENADECTCKECLRLSDEIH